MFTIQFCTAKSFTGRKSQVEEWMWEKSSLLIFTGPATTVIPQPPLLLHSKIKATVTCLMMKFCTYAASSNQGSQSYCEADEYPYWQVHRHCFGLQAKKIRKRRKTQTFRNEPGSLQLSTTGLRLTSLSSNWDHVSWTPSLDPVHPSLDFCALMVIIFLTDYTGSFLKLPNQTSANCPSLNILKKT